MPNEKFKVVYAGNDLENSGLTFDYSQRMKAIGMNIYHLKTQFKGANHDYSIWDLSPIYLSDYFNSKNLGVTYMQAALALIINCEKVPENIELIINHFDKATMPEKREKAIISRSLEGLNSFESLKAAFDYLDEKLALKH